MAGVWQTHQNDASSATGPIYETAACCKADSNLTNHFDRKLYQTLLGALKNALGCCPTMKTTWARNQSRWEVSIR
jgi:hypothetical protein